MGKKTSATKRLFTKDKKLKLTYLFIVIFLCYAPSMCSHTKITTPAQDAYQLQQMAQCIESEGELRKLEVLCNEKEQAYRQSYNGAKAMQFRLMTQPIIEEAAIRREGFRLLEDAEAHMSDEFTTLMADMDAAWQITISSEDEALKEYTKRVKACVNAHMKMRAKLIESSKFSEVVMEYNYAEEVNSLQSVLEDEYTTLANERLEYDAKVRHYNLAYRIKYGKVFPNSILLNEYIDAFNLFSVDRYIDMSKTKKYLGDKDMSQKHTRLNAGFEYGDAEFINELLGMVETYDELDRVQSEVIDALLEVQISDKAREMLTSNIKDALKEADDTAYMNEDVNNIKSYVDDSLSTLDAAWGINGETTLEELAEEAKAAEEKAKADAEAKAAMSYDDFVFVW